MGGFSEGSVTSKLTQPGPSMQHLLCCQRREERSLCHALKEGREGAQSTPQLLRRECSSRSSRGAAVQWPGRRSGGPAASPVQSYQAGNMGCGLKTKGAICCAIIGLCIIAISVLSVVVATHQAPIEINGKNAHVKQISEVRNSLIQLDNRVNISGVSLGCIVLRIVLLIMARVCHHVSVKWPNKARKRVVNAEKEDRLLRVEALLKARGYMV